jgi:hypothetical protein
MPESNGDNLENRTAQELEFQQYVKKQFEMLFIRIDKLGTEMLERFLQLSRQIRDLDIKVDVYTREHSYMKDDIRELRAKMNLQ